MPDIGIGTGAGQAVAHSHAEKDDRRVTQRALLPTKGVCVWYVCTYTHVMARVWRAENHVGC